MLAVFLLVPFLAFVFCGDSFADLPEELVDKILHMALEDYTMNADTLKLVCTRFNRLADSEAFLLEEKQRMDELLGRLSTNGLLQTIIEENPSGNASNYRYLFATAKVLSGTVDADTRKLLTRELLTADFNLTDDEEATLLPKLASPYTESLGLFKVLNVDGANASNVSGFGRKLLSQVCAMVDPKRFGVSRPLAKPAPDADTSDLLQYVAGVASVPLLPYNYYWRDYP